MTTRLILPDLSYSIIGCFYDAYREMGPGLLESAYQKAFAYALEDAGIAHEREAPIVLKYKGRTVGEYRLDLLVERQVIIECKTSDTFSPAHLAQLRNYLRVSGHPLGILLLFGSKPLSKRVTPGASTNTQREIRCQLNGREPAPFTE